MTRLRPFLAILLSSALLAADIPTDPMFGTSTRGAPRPFLFATEALSPTLDFVISTFTPWRRAEKLRLAYAAGGPAAPHLFSQAKSVIPSGGEPRDPRPSRRVKGVATPGGFAADLLDLLKQRTQLKTNSRAQLAWDAVEYLTRLHLRDWSAIKNQSYAAQTHINNALDDTDTSVSDHEWLFSLKMAVLNLMSPDPAGLDQGNNHEPKWQILLISIVTFAAGGLSLFHATGSPHLSYAIRSMGAMVFLMAAGLAWALRTRFARIANGDRESLERLFGSHPERTSLPSTEIAARLKHMGTPRALSDPDMIEFVISLTIDVAAIFLAGVLGEVAGIAMLGTLGLAPVQVIVYAALVPLFVRIIHLRIDPADPIGRAVPVMQRWIRALVWVAILSISLGGSAIAGAASLVVLFLIIDFRPGKRSLRVKQAPTLRLLIRAVSLLAALTILAGQALAQGLQTGPGSILMQAAGMPPSRAIGIVAGLAALYAMALLRLLLKNPPFKEPPKPLGASGQATQILAGHAAPRSRRSA